MMEQDRVADGAEGFLRKTLGEFCTPLQLLERIRYNVIGEIRSLLQLLGRLGCVDIAAFEFHWNRDESAFVGTDGIDEEKNIVTSLSFNFVIRERQVCVYQDSTGWHIFHAHFAFVSSARIDEVFFAHL